MFRKQAPPAQQTLWIATHELPATPVNAFYQQLDRALAAVRFGDAVRALCAPFYVTDARRGGRPGIDPEVYFKMLMIGFFEGIASERGIAARCADSLSIRAFLHYALTDATPDHSSFTVIRQRLAPAVYEGVFALVLRALTQQKLLKGQRLAIDTSVLEANAAMRSLEHRLTGEAYGEYVKTLAAAAGVDPTDAPAVRRFDKKRPGRKTSNAEWQSPHDPEAKVGRTKHGVTRMLYKPEHVVDVETGAIVDVEVRPGDAHDTQQLAERVLVVEARLHAALGTDPETGLVKTLIADKGYYKVDELTALDAAYIAPVISDPITTRRLDRLTATARHAVATAKRHVRSERGKAWLRRRGELVERSFQHVLDCGGARRTTLRGRENIRKRYLLQAACANLSLLLRALIGVGTPKQALAASPHAFDVMVGVLYACLTLVTPVRAHLLAPSPARAA